MAFFAYFVTDSSQNKGHRFVQNPGKSRACADAIVRGKKFLHPVAFA
jgi:hypothetical protein